MEITLNHTIVAAKNNVESAKWYQEIFGFEFKKEWRHFAVVKINDTLTFDFYTKTEQYSKQHYAFKVDDKKFDEIFDRITSKGIPYASHPEFLGRDKFNYEINNEYGGRGVYFVDPAGHALEMLTVDYDIESELE